jgi:CO/xanthine dehydrogenase Mo-binding subunit
MTTSATGTPTRTDGGVGTDASRPDGTLKVTGEFAYGSDLWMDDMLWGVTLRSPHPHARIRSLDIGAALAVPGVFAVLTSDDVPGELLYGLEIADQPVLARGTVLYQGEPVALVAADHPETARRACARIAVDYEVLEPVTDARDALGHGTHGPVANLHPEPTPVVENSRENAHLRPEGNLIRHLKVRKGDLAAARSAAHVVVSGEYEVGMQDQAFLGPESGLAVPAEDGGVDLYVSTQWLHVDQQQICRALGLPPEKVRLTLAGVGGAFGGREDLSMHVHACLLAMRTGKPVKMSYNREESFFGHVHRHPARMQYDHGFTADGELLFVEARIWLDGGAYCSSSAAVVGNAGLMGIGPYVVPAVRMDCWGAYTNNPPCGAMRGFGAVQAAFAYESQMDKGAAALGMDPVDIRVRNAMQEGSVAPTGQVVDSAAPVAELLRRLQAMPMPPPATNGDGHDGHDLRAMPGGVSNTTHGEGVRRGVGWAVGYKNIGFSEGFDDSSTARVRLEVVGGEPTVTVHTAAAEVGQGLVTVQQQIARTELGVERVVVAPADTAVGSGGSTSASRQTYVTGGAVQEACRRVRSAVLARAGRDDWESWPAVLDDLAALLGDEHVEETVTWRHRPTEAVDPETGQGNAHVQYAFAAHRAVVDVDVELGLVKVVVTGGQIRNPSFTDYLIPTILDMPPMQVEVLELPDPHAPYGLRGVGEPPTVSSGPAVLAAIRDATGRFLTRVPVRPDDIVLR